MQLLQPYLIFHFFYTGRIFEFQSCLPKNYAKHPKITTNTKYCTTKKCKICSSLHSIWKNFIPDRIFLTGTAWGTHDKYDVWISSKIYMCSGIICCDTMQSYEQSFFYLFQNILEWFVKVAEEFLLILRKGSQVGFWIPGLIGISRHVTLL